MPKPDLKSLMPLPSALQMFTIARDCGHPGRQPSPGFLQLDRQEGALPRCRIPPRARPAVGVRDIGDLEAFIDQARKKGMTLRDFQEADRAFAAKLAAEAAAAE